MLTYEQIITLSDKGFSPDQIVTLTGEELPEKQEPEKQEPEKQEPEKQEPEMKVKPDSSLAMLQDAIKGFSADVAELKKALQASNIRTVIREDIPPSKTADDILAEMIHPTISKEVTEK